jgi:hypothetical protein
MALGYQIYYFVTVGTNLGWDFIGECYGGDTERARHSLLLRADYEMHIKDVNSCWYS